MQTREQVRNWKVIGSLATVAALGVTGLTIANAAPSETPPPIELDDQRTLDSTVTTTTAPGFVIVPGSSVSMDDSLDSPLASSDLDSLASDDSDSPAPTVADDTQASPASPDSVDSPAGPASRDSVDSPASPASVDSPASASGDSADSLDS